MPNVSECTPEQRKERHIVLVGDLNIRDQNRINLNQQQLAPAAIANDVQLLRVVGDKGSYLVASCHPAGQAVALVLTRCSHGECFIEE